MAKEKPEEEDRQQQSRRDKPKRGKVATFLRGIYNPDKKTFVGRTGASWAKIGLFYVIYYICLACFFVGMLSVLLFCIMSTERPMLTGQQSLLKSGPGVSIRPLFRNPLDGTVDSTLIHISTKADGNLFARYKNYTAELLTDYETVKENQETCNLAEDKRASDDITKPCHFNLDQLDVCKDPVSHLQTTETACLFLRVNKIFGWLPPLLDKATTPMVECYGQNAADIENLGKPTYYPSVEFQGKQLGRISHAFFPYLRQANYSTPLVAMTFPAMKKNVVILIKCQVRGIGENAGESQFELLVDTV